MTSAAPSPPAPSPHSATLIAGTADAPFSVPPQPVHAPVTEAGVVQGVRPASLGDRLGRLNQALGVALTYGLLSATSPRAALQATVGSGAARQTRASGVRPPQGAAVACPCAARSAAVQAGPAALLLVLDPPLDANTAAPATAPAGGAGGSVGNGSGGTTGAAALAALLLLAAVWGRGRRLRTTLILPAAFAPIPPPG
jgi:hypothetical protein